MKPRSITISAAVALLLFATSKNQAAQLQDIKRVALKSPSRPRVHFIYRCCLPPTPAISPNEVYR
jgi:hypothetical protein